MQLKPALHLVGLLLTWFFENVLKEGINIACKTYFAVRSIWTFDWPRVGASQKMIPREKLPAPPHRVAR